ncbi:MAG: PDZ domain-containing protein [Clostridia bacterium]|nr:PDZ domain-containing protein [Clostridia bacterium]
MNKKVSLGVCISLIIVAVTATFSITMVASQQIYNRIISNISQRSQIYSSVDEINQIISNYYYGTVDDVNVLNAALSEGYINGLGDSGSRYLTASEYAAYTSKLEGGVKGIGVETAYNYGTGEFVITHVYAGSPAETVGLKALDVITAIQNKTVTRGNYAVLSESLYGDILSSVQIEYERDGETKVVEPMLGFAIPGVIGELRGDVGYIRISGFYKNTADEFKKMIASLEEQGAESFVFDVRNTSEGTIEYAAQVIDVIVPTVSGNLAVAKDKSGEIYNNKVFTSESSSINKPIAVLINSYTSGPAELFACDLRDISQAHVIGTKSAGIGTMQEIFTLEDGGAVLLTVAVIEPKNGAEAVYNEKGIEPTVEVTLLTGDEANIALLTPEQDNQLATAINMLSNQ